MLRSARDRGQIWAKLEQDILEVRVGDSRIAHAVARVRCLQTNSVGFTNLEPKITLEEAKLWIDGCHKNHAGCGNLPWSDRNPSRLVHILPGLKNIQLVDAQLMKQVSYTALSYAWGGDATDDEEEKAFIKSPQDRSNDVEPFPVSELPATIQHAIEVTKNLDIDYIWIDALCIRKTSDDSGWNSEASRMHEVYGNARVTLFACSGEKSTDGLFHSRDAWEYISEPCRLDRFWLANFDMALDEVRTKASLFSRAWTLQEERLSPRILYLCGQRLYWSCSFSQRSELDRLVGNNPPRRKPYEDPTPSKWLRRPQEFLQTQRQGKEELLHQQWLEIVRDYTRRDMYRATDRFPAICGLAVQYLVPFCSNGQVKREEYLAGLWRQTFAQDLAWMVQGAGSLSKNLRNIAPSWSWASLPLRTVVNMQHEFIETTAFTLLETSRLGKGEADDVLGVAQRGAEIKAVVVRGLLRHFVNEVSQWVAWSTVKSSHGKEKGYDFQKYLAKSVHSVSDTNGEILAYEPHMRPIVGWLDYRFLEDEQTEWTKALYCLKIGESSMLLLEKAEMVEKDNIFYQGYRRAGISTDFREGFFANDQAKLQNFVLV